jgi:GTP cyclohydrolase I
MSIDGALIPSIEDTLTAMGIDLTDENFKDTPKRWLKFLNEFMQPFDSTACLKKAQFAGPAASEYEHALIVQSNIPYQAVCAHHLVQVLGRAHVGYISSGPVVGLSKLTRLVHGFSHEMPSLQEDVGNKIVDALLAHLEAVGAMCVIKAEHGCMACRGVAQLDITTSTASLRGVFIKKHEVRQEFYNIIGV